MIVVDTNIISFLLLPTPFSEKVDQLYQFDSEWMAPLLWKSEFRNVLALYLRKNLLTFDKALQIQENAELIMAQHEFDIPSVQVLSLVNESNCSSYDCEFVALARKLNTPLITQDTRLLKEFTSTAISVANFLDQKA